MRFDSVWTLLLLLGAAGVLTILADAVGLPAWWVPATVGAGMVVGRIVVKLGCRP